MYTSFNLLCVSETFSTSLEFNNCEKMGWKALSKMVQALIITGIVLVVIAGIGIGIGILIKSKAIETGMILSIMDMKKTPLCIFFKDLYSPR